jgi:hypothetical protein
MSKKQIKEELDKLHCILRNVHRDNLAHTNIHGLEAVKNLRKLLGVGDYVEESWEDKRAKLLADMAKTDKRLGDYLKNKERSEEYKDSIVELRKSIVAKIPFFNRYAKEKEQEDE